jgi:pimeloyl-ACP methyl ester carboxylesterase
VIAYDRLGFGESDPREDVLGRRFIAEEAETIFPFLGKALGFDRAILFGHSVGGGMAATCAALVPSRCAALITESAQAFVEDRTIEGILAAQQMFRRPDQLDRLSRYHGAKARWVLDAWIDTWLAPDFGSWSLEPILPRIACPTLVIHGDADEYGTPRHAEIIAAGVAGPSTLEVMAGVHHVPHREEEDRVVGLVEAFLRGLEA